MYNWWKVKLEMLSTHQILLANSWLTQWIKYKYFFHNPCQLYSTGKRWGSVLGFCENMGEPSTFIKAKYFLTSWLQLKKHPVVESVD
jgi:hypothetical protein